MEISVKWRKKEGMEMDECGIGNAEVGMLNQKAEKRAHSVMEEADQRDQPSINGR